MRRQRQRDRKHDEHGRCNSAAAAQLALREPAAAALLGGEIAPAQEQAGQGQATDRADDHDHRDHVAHRIGNADRRDLQIGLRRQHVADVEQQRSRKVVKDLDENQGRAGDIAGQRERKHNAQEQREPVRAKVLCRLLHGRIDIGQRGRQVEQNERKVVQCFDENNAVEPLHERNAESEPIHHQEIDGAVAAVDQLHGHSAHKRRHDQGHDAERVDQRRAAEPEARENRRQRHGDQARHHDGHRRNIERVPERLAQQVGAEEIAEVNQGKAALRMGKGHHEDADDRDDQEGEQENRNHDHRGDLRHARAVTGGEREARRAPGRDRGRGHG